MRDSKTEFESPVSIRKKKRSSSSPPEASPQLFDEEFYRACCGDSIPAGVDPVDDYLERGWKLGYDPSKIFSTSYYLERNKDVAESGFNPLVHYVLYGRAEGRRPVPFISTVKDYSHKPSVSVIIPIYNHAAFLPLRIGSILSQAYENMELIVLDDASTDDSVEVVEGLLAATDIPFRIIRNATNSGSIFSQWEKGLLLAEADIVWICESDDYCEPGFLREIVPLFADDSIMLAFGDIQFCDVKGDRLEGLDHYRESAEPDVWNTTLIRPAAEWFRKAFSVRNVIPNVGGCVFRNQHLSDQEWSDLRKYSIVGDWFFYLTVARGGRIAYEPAAQAYFRQHGRNSSVKSFAEDIYYIEHQSIAKSMADRWGASRANVALMQQHLRKQYDMFYPSQRREFAALFDADHIAALPRRQTHVLICMLGFYLGGGELFPIRLANLLVERGLVVSMLILKTAEEEQGLREKLDRRVAVYHLGMVEEAGKSEFLSNMSVDIIHSHNLLAEQLFFDDEEPSTVPYVVTLHGSYESATLDEAMMRRIVRGVDHWVYLTERNLAFLKPQAIDEQKISRIANAVEVKEHAPPFTRKELGISDDAFIFTVLSRAIKEKGWEQTALAFERVSAKQDREMHLIFCGIGPEAAQLGERFASANVHFIGFQSDPHAVYRISDCAVLASRFGGESYPLTIIEALQVCRPVICTDVGECRAMIRGPEGEAGIIIEALPDDQAFISQLEDAMKAMAKKENYDELKARATALSKRFDHEDMLDAYLALYTTMQRE